MLTDRQFVTDHFHVHSAKRSIECKSNITFNIFIFHGRFSISYRQIWKIDAAIVKMILWVIYIKRSIWIDRWSLFVVLWPIWKINSRLRANDRLCFYRLSCIFRSRDMWKSIRKNCGPQYYPWSGTL